MKATVRANMTNILIIELFGSIAEELFKYLFNSVECNIENVNHEIDGFGTFFTLKEDKEFKIKIEAVGIITVMLYKDYKVFITSKN